MAAPLDIALAWQPNQRWFDVMLAPRASGGMDFALDRTPATQMIVSLVCDRRAQPDDTLPQAITDFATPETLTGARGWCADFLDPLGRLCGGRFWLFDREKQTEAVRRRGEAYAAEALAGVETRWLVALTITVRWLRRGVLAVTAIAGPTRVQVLRGVAG